MNKTISVGSVSVPLPTAATWVGEYTDARKHHSKNPSAYPAYDSLETGNSPNELNGGDLLAPTLLNAAPSVAAYNRLLAMAPRLESALQSCPTNSLAKATDEAVHQSVRALYEVLDDDHTNFPAHGLGGTTLSKVLHRKRPAFLCLHDKWVWSCYVRNGPVPRSNTRLWADYMVLLSLAMRDDLIRQGDAFVALRSEVQGDAPLSDLRILDILAWRSKGDDPE